MRLPIVQHHWPSPSPSDIRRAVETATDLRSTKPRLRRPSRFAPVACTEIGDEPALQIDDYSEIPLPNRERDAIYMQQRACLRAAPGDWIVTNSPVDPGYIDYFENRLGIVPQQWITAESASGPTKLAISCIRSRSARRTLCHAIRRKGLRYIHPHFASFDVWELAAWLHEFTRMPLQVIGPPVEVCRFANDKVEFADLVARLFGRRFVPSTKGAYCIATLSGAVQELARSHPFLGVKIPNGVGGHGNLFVDTRDVAGKSLREIHSYLGGRFAAAGISTAGRMLVDVWETAVLKSGSIQTWIPPLSEGPPIIEGLFEQIIKGETGQFHGSRELHAPPALGSQIVDQTYLLTIVFQHLGYVGRCSFDFLLVGESMETADVEYIECNGRWGGTSAPMTFANRMLGDYEHERSFETLRVADPRFAAQSFTEIAASFGDTLYDARTGKGNVVLFNPARASLRSEIESIRWNHLRRSTSTPSTREAKPCTTTDDPLSQAY